MRLDRRDFMKSVALGTAAAVLTGCQFPRRYVVLEPHVRAPEEQLTGMATWYASTCRQCPAGCGIVVRVMNGRAVKIEGNPEHPLNQGKLCARGQAGLQLLYNPDRLAGPIRQDKRGSRRFAPTSWNEAINTLFGKLQAAEGSVAIWMGSSLSGHVYDLLQRFSQAVGAPSPLLWDLYTQANGYRVLQDAGLQMAPTSPSGLSGHDLGRADVVFSFGAGFLGPWISQVRYGVEYGRFRGQPLGKRGYLVHFSPRMSITAAKADEWLPIAPGTEALVARALAGLVAESTGGAESSGGSRAALAQSLAGNVDVAAAAQASGISLENLRRLASLFSAAQRPLAIPGPSVTGWGDNVADTLAVQALNLLSGSGGLLPNAPVPVGVPGRPVPATFGDALSLVERMRAGQVQVLLVHGANPAYDLPGTAAFADAIQHVPYVVSFSPIVDETCVSADLILPDRTYLESWGYELVSPNFGMPIVGSQQPVVVPAFDARATSDVILSLARGLPAAAAALPWSDEVALIRSSVSRLPPGAFPFDSAGLLWAGFLQYGGWWPAHGPVAVATAESVAIPGSLSLPPPQPQTSELLFARLLSGEDAKYPLYAQLYVSDLLGVGQGASLPWLQGSPDPMTTISWHTWVEVHPDTASKLGLKDGDVVRVVSAAGAIELPVYLYPGIRPDTVGIPLGQGHTDLGRYARNRGANPINLLAGGSTTVIAGAFQGSLRVRLERTGRRQGLAAFESRIGVMQGFINQGTPG